MVLSEKLIKLRKGRGWSQEDVAEKLGISRQAVSKWESSAALPDIDKLYRIAKLYGVSADYLLDDRAESAEKASDIPSDDARTISLSDAAEVIKVREDNASRVALAVSLCILSPVFLILLCGIADSTGAFSGNAAAGIGITVLLAMVAAAVCIFIGYGMKAGEFGFLEKDDVVIGRDVRQLAERGIADSDHEYRVKLIAGVMLCILSPVPLFLTLIFTESDLYMIYAVCALLAIVASGVNLLVSAAVRRSAYDMLLENGDYAPEKKRIRKRSAVFSGAYWPCIVAVYLAVSFITGKWELTWVVWPVAALIHAALISCIYGRSR